ncbi:MAG TPA: CRTAC1 family protein [Longimicrobiales bacterium]|nr:CRTAC1 family protein [Longimicrobiales bacterium]
MRPPVIRPGTTALLCAAILVPLAGCRESEPAEEARASYTRPADAYARGPAGANSVPFRFTDATAAAGIDFEHMTGAFGNKWMPETMGSGGGFLDYDGDGLPDLFLVNSAEWPGHQWRPAAHSALYRNRGDGTFEDVSAETGIARLTAGIYGMGATFGDYDGDGDLDIYVTAVGDNLLLRNDGGRFTDVTADAGVSGNAPAPAPPAWSTAAAWLDADRDGRLDLFVCNYVRWTPETDLFTTLDGVHKSYATPQQYPGESCRLYRNRDGRRFEDVTRAAGVWNEEGKALGVVVVDFDGDGWPDVMVANDTQPNFLYRNNGDGTFTEIGLQAGVAFDEFGRARAGMGVDAADVTGQGRLSIAIGNFSQEALALYTEVGEGVFQDLAGSARLSRPTLLPLTFGVAFVDLDLDGFQDLVIANGHIEPEINAIHERSHFEQPPQLFHNTGRGSFVEVGEAAGEAFARPAVGRGVAVADYDRDGDPDVLITVNGGPPRLLRNDTPPEALGSWLRLRLEGRPPNTHAVGATVTVFAGDRVQRRRVRTGSSYLSQSETNPLLFGLGPLGVADSVRVEWPTVGRGSTTAGPLRAGRTHTIREGG